MFSSHLFFMPSSLDVYQPGSHSRTSHPLSFLLRCMSLFFSREGFSRSFPSSTVKSNFVYDRQTI